MATPLDTHLPYLSSGHLSFIKKTPKTWEAGETSMSKKSNPMVLAHLGVPLETLRAPPLHPKVIHAVLALPPPPKNFNSRDHWSYLKKLPVKNQ